MEQLDADLTRHLTQGYLHIRDKAYQARNKGFPMTRASVNPARGYNFVQRSVCWSIFKPAEISRIGDKKGTVSRKRRRLFRRLRKRAVRQNAWLDRFPRRMNDSVNSSFSRSILRASDTDVSMFYRWN